ncbi:MAG: hypothetical protein M3137_01905 [Actinomycetota bacterium]|nr:hypothetical protein [Actinomycetota bacterium]
MGPSTILATGRIITLASITSANVAASTQPGMATGPRRTAAYVRRSAALRPRSVANRAITNRPATCALGLPW